MTVNRKQPKEKSPAAPRVANGAYLFFGEDDFSIRRKVDFWRAEFAKKYSAEGIVFLDREELEEKEAVKRLEQALAPSLFAREKLLVLKNFFPARASENYLTSKLVAAVENLPENNFLLFWQTKKIDKRLNAVKQLLNSGLKAEEFKLPHALELNRFIANEAKRLGILIDDSAVERLAQAVGRDLSEEKKIGGRVVETKEAFNLWEVSSELKKLAGLSEQVTLQAVNDLVAFKSAENVFELTDEIVKGNRQNALRILQSALDAASADEKSEAIRLVALIAEQLRSLILVGLLLKKNASQANIAERLGWSSGRVFMTMKRARETDTEKLKNLLKKLVVIDTQLKSESVSPRLLLSLFAAEA